MARPKDENYDGKKETILKAAARVFAEQGFLRTNIIEIGQASGASKSRMYHYFASKEALLAELLMSHLQALLEAAGHAARAANAGPARLRALIDAHIEQYMGAYAEHKLLLSEPGNLPQADRARLLELEDRLVRLMTEVLREVAPERLKTPALARVHAMLVYGMLNWTFTWYKPDGSVSPRQLAEHVYRMALGGLCGELDDSMGDPPPRTRRASAARPAANAIASATATPRATVRRDTGPRRA